MSFDRVSIPEPQSSGKNRKREEDSRFSLKTTETAASGLPNTSFTFPRLPVTQSESSSSVTFNSLPRTASLHNSNNLPEPEVAVIVDTSPSEKSAETKEMPPKKSVALDKDDNNPDLNRALSMRTGKPPQDSTVFPSLLPQSPKLSRRADGSNSREIQEKMNSRLAIPNNLPPVANKASHGTGINAPTWFEGQPHDTHSLKIDDADIMEPTTEEILQRKTYQIRALTRKTLSYQKRQIFVNVCCIALCPFFMVAISAIMGTLLRNLVNKATTFQRFAYCSNTDAMNSTWNLPLKNNFPVASKASISSLPDLGNIQMTNIMIGKLTAGSGSRPTVPPQIQCALWSSKNFLFSKIYERDPFADMTNPNFASFLNNATETGRLARKFVRLDSTFRPDIKYGWLNPSSISSDPINFADLTSTQQFPWALVLEGPNIDVGFKKQISRISNMNSIPSAIDPNTMNGLLGQIPSTYYLQMNYEGDSSPSSQTFSINGFDQVPFFSKLASSNTSEGDINKMIANYIKDAISSLGDIDKSVLFDSDPGIADRLKYALNVSRIVTKVPWGAIIVKEYDLAARKLVVTLQIGTDSRLAQAGSFPSPGFRRFWLSGMLSNALISLANPGYSITHGLRAMPSIISNEIDLPFGSFIGRILFPFGISFLFPIFVIILVQEKEDRIFVMMKMNGVRTLPYNLSHSIHFFAMHLVVMFVFIVSGLAFRLELFTRTDPSVYIILFLLWGLLQIALAFFMASFFSHARSALVISFLTVLLNVIINVTSDNLFSSRAPFFYLLWPPFAFYRALGVINRASFQADLQPYRFSLMFTPGTEVYACVMYQIIMFFILIIVSPYLANVLPSSYGIRKPWHYPITQPWKKYTGYAEKRAAKDRSNYLANIDEQEVQFEDDDVRKERERVENTDFGPEYPLVVKRMRKIYPASTKIAVKNISFAVEKGQIFGLLGPNGAGKTSLISILTGLYETTLGEARVGGFDIITQPELAYKVTGICPQHDILWNDLTVEEHLLFYARVKGIPPQQEKAVVRKAIESVSLQKFTTRLSKGLSGGEKRRLSIAIALIGSPKAVFFGAGRLNSLMLDEPTTGLDPEVRRVIWNIVQGARRDRTIILTTHSMEEAEVLCQRIAIMARGTLRCIGPLLRLKQLYGSGFKLVILAKPEDLEYSFNKVREILPTDAAVVDCFQSSMTIEFEPRKESLAGIFASLQEHREEWKIEDWGISQTSLEEVFLKLVSETDAEGTAEG